MAYGAGLSVSEIAHLKIDDIDISRTLIRIEQGKGSRDRNAMLSLTCSPVCYQSEVESFHCLADG
jgi:site-specific recombinase XerD